jgi:hypothetical protein
MVEQTKDQVRWAWLIVLAMLLGVLPWTLFLFGISAGIVGSAMLCILLVVAVAFAYGAFMRRKVLKPMLGQRSLSRREWIAVWVILVPGSVSFGLLTLHLGSSFGEIILTFGLLVACGNFFRWYREAYYWFEKHKALQTENEDLKRRLGSSI